MEGNKEGYNAWKGRQRSDAEDNNNWHASFAHAQARFLFFFFCNYCSSVKMKKRSDLSPLVVAVFM
jgi:hypothetical protein